MRANMWLVAILGSKPVMSYMHVLCALTSYDNSPRAHGTVKCCFTPVYESPQFVCVCVWWTGPNAVAPCDNVC